MEVTSLVHRLTIFVMRVFSYLEQKFYIVNFLEILWIGVILLHSVKKFCVNHLEQ
uniref:Uncharacterized protein n=1 Tax=Rousettus aegyptiacus TaxID=9407 RepID=A0A7J8BBW8_ROUAE|nr:hypothetical protein HJG63_002466 [Rousettus aegyptiacus]